MARRSTCDSLWKVWYSVFIIATYVYLFYNAINRYSDFRKQALRNGWPHGAMNFYLSMMIIVISLLPIFLYCTIFKTGNYANDGTKIGASTIDMKREEKRSCHRFHRLRRHFLPFSCLAHIMSAYFLLIPLPVLVGSQILYGKYPKELMWHTDMDFMFNHHLLIVNISDTQSTPERVQSLTLTPEFINYLVALLILMARYPSTFWQTSRSYAVCFSFLIFVANMMLVVDFCGMSLLYKVTLNAYLVGIKDSAIAFLITPWSILLFSVMSLLLILAANVAVFEYGYSQYLVDLKLSNHYDIVVNHQSIGGNNIQRDPKFCSNKYLPQMYGICLLFFTVCCKLPVLWTLIHVYQFSKISLLPVCLTLSALYFVIWAIFWFLFTYKKLWHFIILDETTLSIMSASHSIMRLPDEACLVNEETFSQSSLNRKSLVRPTNNYVYVHSTLPNISSVSENVELISESSYNSCEKDANEAFKYAIRKTSGKSVTLVQEASPSLSACGSLQRNSKFNKSCNRVTFKEHDEMIPGSPRSDLSMHNASIGSDSGIESTRPICMRDSRASSNFSSEYAIFGNLFDEHHYYNQSDFASYSAMYNEPDYLHVPDILKSDTAYRQDSDESFSFQQAQQQVNGTEYSHFDEKLCSEV